MGLNCLDVIEVRLPILDHAIVITRYQPVITVGPLDGSDGGLMGLKTSGV